MSRFCNRSANQARSRRRSTALPHLPPVPGGAARQDSVRAGLEALAPQAPDIVLVHDAARPIVPAQTVPDLLSALRNAPGAIPAVPSGTR